MEKINFTEPKINGKDPVDYFANFTETKINSMGIRVEYITPDKAKRYLSGNQNNRKLSTSIVNQYSESIKRGEWKLNGESIKFDNDGKIDRRTTSSSCYNKGKHRNTNARYKWA